MLRNTLPSVLCTLILCSLLLVSIASWVMAVLGMDVCNVLSPEGYRWVCLHVMSSLMPAYLSPLIALVVIVGCIEHSRIVKVLLKDQHTVNEKLGLITAFVAFFILSSPVVVPVFKVKSALRSVTGQLLPSPWFYSMPFALSLIVFLSTLFFCLFAYKDNFFRLVGSLLSAGISRYAIWLVDFSLFSLLVDIIRYVTISY